MSAATASFFYKPTFKFSSNRSSKINSLKPISFPHFPTSKLVFSGGFVSRESGILGPHTMVELTKASAFRSSDGEEGVRAIEQEGFFNGSSEFHPQLVADGFQSTLNRLSKWLVAALFGAVILWRHDAEALWIAMGSVLNAMLSVILKRVLNHERPVSTLRSDPGMPSSHAQSIFFTVMVAVLSVFEWLGINELTLIISAFALASGSYLAWLRVSQQLHTVNQVVVGAALGCTFSIFWYWSWNAFVLKAFVSSFWVRVFVVLGAAGFCLGFLIYVIRNWVIEER